MTFGPLSFVMWNGWSLCLWIQLEETKFDNQGELAHRLLLSSCPFAQKMIHSGVTENTSFEHFPVCYNQLRYIVDKVNVFTLPCHHCRFWDIRRLVLIFGAFWSFFRQSRMFPSIRECTRARWESFPQQRKSKIAIYHRAQRSKFEIRNSSSCFSCLLLRTIHQYRWIA